MIDCCCTLPDENIIRQAPPIVLENIHWTEEVRGPLAGPNHCNATPGRHGPCILGRLDTCRDFNFNTFRPVAFRSLCACSSIPSKSEFLMSITRSRPLAAQEWRCENDMKIRQFVTYIAIVAWKCTIGVWHTPNTCVYCEIVFEGRFYNTHKTFWSNTI